MIGHDVTSRNSLCAVLCFLLSLATGSFAYANEVHVEDAKAFRSGDGSFRFSVSLRHADNGWEHYADRWQVISPQGDILATRVLMHPHDHEQPFTRSLSGVSIREGISWVTIRGHDKVHGDGAGEFKVSLPGR